MKERALQPNTTLQGGKYRIQRVLGQGGFGITYEGYDEEFEETVAIKEFFLKGVTERNETTSFVKVSNSDNVLLFDEQKEKFKKEARRLRKLKNDHIVRVHDLFEENGTAYYVMDYIDGENLAARLKRQNRPMSEHEVLAILPQILDALKTVHAAGIWHLDLKPANIMVDKSGNAYLIDFGASKQIRASGGVTTSTALCYTPGYAPNEQTGQLYDRFGPWTDIYALGATVYNLLTNKRPPMSIDIDEDGESAFDFPAGISQNLRQDVIWMMQPRRTARPQSVEELKERFSTPHVAQIDDTVMMGHPIHRNESEDIVFNVKDVSFKMIHVEGGTFMMGATEEQGDDAWDDEKPVHRVTLSDYWMGETQVTQALWQAVMVRNHFFSLFQKSNPDPSCFKGSQRPVERVSWNDCQKFVNKLNSLLSSHLPAGRKFRLPTEAEWEYAARGGNRSGHYKYSGSNNLGSVAWYVANSGFTTHDVKTKNSNELGIYDMSGNVWEWCQDWYGDYDVENQINPTGPSSGSIRVVRGGSWVNFARDCRVSNRDGTFPSYRRGSMGLRVAL